MPPEMLSRRKEGYCAAKVDVWSCGMVLFACLAGYVPYKCDTGDESAILEEIMGREEIEFPERLSEGVRDLLRRSLEKDPNQRMDMQGLRDHAWTTGGEVDKVDVRAKELEGVGIAVSPVTPAERGPGGGWC
eukprot:GFKZ01007884.1.p1 GENE.GFKZ01007884.1~~GFKZ01007884.1.p1  ORF type:complete len:132 (-),score=20.95 GFKZ01007884.1:277-672(-)